MADAKISALTSLTGAGAAQDDLLAIVDTSAATTKKITREEFFKSVDYISFDTTNVVAAPTEGQLTWDTAEKTLSLGLNGGNTVLQLGQETHYRVRNNTGTQIPDGTVVRFSGVLGSSGIMTVAPALADGTYPSSYIIGVTTENISHGADGLVAAFGKVRGIDTSSFAVGDILYASPTVAGGFTTTRPSGSQNIVSVAAVLSSHANNGIIFVRPHVEEEKQNFTTRASLVSAVSNGFIPVNGETYFADGLAYIGSVGSTEIPDLPGLLPSGETDMMHFGFIGNGTKVDTDKANLAITYASPGKVTLLKPGTYLLANTNPYPYALYPGITESDANWWANRRALWVSQDDTTIELGKGVVLKVADGENCHAIQIGQYTLGSIGITGFGVERCSVVGSGWEIDMNGANQTPATSTKDHCAAILVNHNSKKIEVSGGYIHDSSYYGLGFEGNSADTLAGFEDCYVHDIFIEDTKADGFDAKDFKTTSRRNTAERITVVNCGSGGIDFLTEQSGFDFRGGWTVKNCNVSYTDSYAGGRVAFRAQYAPDYAISDYPTRFENCRAITSGKVSNTIGFRLSGRDAESTNCVVVGFNEAFRISSPYTRIRGAVMKNCYYGWRAFTDSGAGWDADSSDLIDAEIISCDVAWRVDTGVSSARILGGSITGIVTPLEDYGTFTRIWGVSGFSTRTKLLATVPVDSVGLKTITIAHGLLVTPALADCQITEQKGSNVSDYSLGFLRVASTDATNVVFEALVTQASSTPSSSFSARVTIRTMEP